MSDELSEYPIILYNAIQCPDGAVIESRYRYDFVMHKQEDGREYFVDGGKDYQRIGYSDKEFTNLLVTTDSPHERIREVFTWVSCLDAAGNRLPAYVTKYLKDLDDNHVKALVKYTAVGYPEYINKIIKDEFSFRGLVWNWNELEG